MLYSLKMAQKALFEVFYSKDNFLSTYTSFFII